MVFDVGVVHLVMCPLCKKPAGQQLPRAGFRGAECAPPGVVGDGARVETFCPCARASSGQALQESTRGCTPSGAGVTCIVKKFVQPNV